MASRAKPRDNASTIWPQLMDRLQKYAGLSSAEVLEIRDFIVMGDYFRQPNHTGGVVRPGERWFFADGSEHTIDDVPLFQIVKSVTYHIERLTDSARRTEIYHKVLADVPGHKAMPDWDRPVVNPNEHPLTPFSVKISAAFHMLRLPVSNM